MDCFVEVVTHQEANFAVGRFYVLRSQGVPGILRNMFLRMHAANHGQLMEELFIRAKNVRWVGNKAIIEPSADDNDPGFAGFVTREELAMMVKHAEVPYRVSCRFCHMRCND